MMRVALFVTCLADALFPDVGRATVTVLKHAGCEVEFPLEQVCCGQMHANSGYRQQALALVRRHTEVFSSYDAVVTPSGSCAAAARYQHAALASRAGDDRLASKVRALAAKTYELSEFLIDVLGAVDLGASFPHRVTYHPTCHSTRLLQLGERPLELLRHVRGLELAPLPDASTCCGFGGTFAIKNADTSTAMLADKMAAVRSTGAEYVTAADASCLMHIGGGLARLRAGIRPIHLAEILATREEVAGA
jgi:L-lactate dehydrogenase complex protein LldE